MKSHAAPSVEALGIFLATTDVPRLVAWYKAIGIPLTDEGYCVVGDPEGGSVFSIQEAQPGALAANPKDDLPEEPYGRRRATLNLRVQKLEPVLAALRKLGGEIAGPKDAGYGTFAWAKDPDGNVVELWEAAA